MRPSSSPLISTIYIYNSVIQLVKHLVKLSFATQIY